MSAAQERSLGHQIFDGLSPSVSAAQPQVDGEPMSVEQWTLVLHHSRARGTDKVVLLGIANHDGDGGAWPKVETLAQYANVSRSTVQEALTRLIASGELVRHQQAGGTASTAPGFRPNRYEILVTCPPGCDRTTQHRTKRLSRSPADLLTSGTPSTGPHPDGAPPTGLCGARSTGHEPSLEPTTTTKVSTSVTGTRANCSICSLPAPECIRRAATSGHTYTPAGQKEASALISVASTPGDRADDDGGGWI